MRIHSGEQEGDGPNTVARARPGVRNRSALRQSAGSHGAVFKIKWTQTSRTFLARFYFVLSGHRTFPSIFKRCRRGDQLKQVPRTRWFWVGSFWTRRCRAFRSRFGGRWSSWGRFRRAGPVQVLNSARTCERAHLTRSKAPQLLLIRLETTGGPHPAELFKTKAESWDFFFFFLNAARFLLRPGQTEHTKHNLNKYIKKGFIFWLLKRKICFIYNAVFHIKIARASRHIPKRYKNSYSKSNNKNAIKTT